MRITSLDLVVRDVSRNGTEKTKEIRKVHTKMEVIQQMQDTENTRIHAPNNHSLICNTTDKHDKLKNETNFLVLGVSWNPTNSLL